MTVSKRFASALGEQNHDERFTFLKIERASFTRSTRPSDKAQHSKSLKGKRKRM